MSDEDKKNLNPEDTNENPKDEDELQEQINKLQAELDKEKSEKSNTVEEIKEMRLKIRELEDEKRNLESKNSEPEDDVSKKVKEILDGKEKERSKKSKELALQKFFSENKEFHPDNDPGEIKRSALLREFNSFNTNGLLEVDEFVTVLNKAKRLVTTKINPEPESTEITPKNDNNTPDPTPKFNEPSKLSSEERQLIKDIGWTEERFLKVKQSQPKYVESLLKT